MLKTSAAPALLPRMLLVVVAALLAAAATFALPLPAHAHDQLVSTDPAADSTMEALPAQVTLTFSADLLAERGATDVVVTDASGADLTPDPPVVEGNVVTQELSGRGQGLITVQWRVASGDGHPVSGKFAFTVAEAETSPTTSTITPTAPPTPSATPTRSATPTPSATPSAISTPTPAADPSEPDFDSRPWIITGLIIFAAVGGAVLYLLLSYLRRQKALDEGENSGSGPDTDR